MNIDPKSLAIIASAIHVSAFLFYNKDIFKGKISPNAVSWFLWAFITVLNFTSYKAMTGDWVVSLLPTAGSVMCIFTFFLALFKGRFKKLDRMEIIVLIIGIIAAIVWWISRSATYANVIVQGCVILAFIPTYRSTWRNPKNEKPLPWFMWGTAFVVGLIVVILQWEGKWAALIYPITNAINHTSIAILALRKKKA